MLYQLRRPEMLAALLGRDFRDPAWLAEAATIPVVVEWPRHHMHPGGKVVFLDGHVEFVKYPGNFPMTEEFIEGLKALDEMYTEADGKSSEEPDSIAEEGDGP